MICNQHIGHCKPIMNDKFLIWFFFQCGETLANYGYYHVRHRTCVHLMILKKINDYEIRKQRTLGILDSEFNHNNQFIGRNTTKNGILLDTIVRKKIQAW